MAHRHLTVRWWPVLALTIRVPATSPTRSTAVIARLAHNRCVLLMWIRRSAAPAGSSPREGQAEQVREVTRMVRVPAFGVVIGSCHDESAGLHVGRAASRPPSGREGSG